MAEKNGQMRFYRDMENKLFMGVFSGLSGKFGIDPTLLRIAVAVALLAVFGLAGGIVIGVVLYALLVLLMPESPKKK
jgi:phage shock protein PspC (stress-responsive transcriptional regulator)